MAESKEKDSITRVNPVRTHGFGMWGNPRIVFGVRVDEGLKKQFNLASQALFGSNCNPVECFMASVVGIYQNQDKLRVNPSNTVNIGEIKIERNIRERRKLSAVVNSEVDITCEFGGACQNVAIEKGVYLESGKTYRLCKFHFETVCLNNPKAWMVSK